jgi:hypothetical protein
MNGARWYSMGLTNVVAESWDFPERQGEKSPHAHANIAASYVAASRNRPIVIWFGEELTE